MHESWAADGAAPDPGRTAVRVEDFEATADLFRALGSPVRVALVALLLDGGRCVHELVDALALPQPQISQHLRVLRDARVLTRVRAGREVTYVLADTHVAHIVHDAVTHTTDGHPGARDPGDRAPGDRHPGDRHPGAGRSA